MAYDEELADRVRELLATDHDVVEKKMFGGLAFLIGGNMSVSASGRGGLLLRCDPEGTDALVREPHVGRFEMRGRAMDGWLRVDADAVQSREELERWVAVGVDYARSLPPKS
jgi:TfoX/Sxy family transcriptional regulator of competence genes